MARRSGFSHKGVEEKRRSLPIYQHYTLSPGKTKSHHPEAKCNHCLKEFVCGSKQRLIRHLRKCNSIQNPEQIIAETLNTLARNSATGTLNHSILEASNLLPSQLAHTAHLQQQQQHQTHLINHGHPAIQHQSPNSAAVTNGSNNNNNNNIVTNTNNVVASSNHLPHHINHNNNTIIDPSLIAGSSNGVSTLQPITPAMISAATSVQGLKRSQRRGRKSAQQSQLASGALLNGPAIHVTTGLDGKAHYSPASQLTPANMIGSLTATSAAPSGVASPSIAQVHNGRGHHLGYAYTTTTVQQQAPACSTVVVSHNNHHQQLANNTNSPHHMTPQINQLHNSPSSYNNKLSLDHIDKSYLKLVLTRNLPLSLCDTKEFQLWVKTLANDYKPPTSINLIAQNLRNEAQVARHRISNIFVKAPKKTINLELHNWSDLKRGRIWYGLIANIDQKRFLISIKDIYQCLRDLHLANQQQNNSHTIESTGVQLDYQASSPLLTINSIHDSSMLQKTLSNFINDCIKRVGSDRINSLLFSGSGYFDSLVLKVQESLYTSNPSIVTSCCWWHFTNLLCADIVEQEPTFEQILRSSNRLISFINRRSFIAKNLRRFNPFAEVSGPLGFKKNDKRWYSHLVCYLLEYIKNNYEAISRALNGSTSTPPSSSKQTQQNSSSSSAESNNNTSDTSDEAVRLDQQHQSPQSIVIQAEDVQQETSPSTQQDQTPFLYPGDSQFEEIKSIFNSTDYWNNLNLVLSYLKPIRDLVALTSTATNSNQSTNSFNHTTTESTSQPLTLSRTFANGLLLTDYMSWFLDYGKTLFNSWQQGQDSYKYDLIGRYLNRFSSSINEFKLAFAAYLLNPKHKCAFMTQTAKNIAIEEILNIASEFMPEESDGHTIFDQWKLYLVREEPYDVVYEESRTSLEWWMSLPCAESIRRVALRILRLKAFSSPKLETLFSQLYFYEDETNASLSDTSYEDIAILRYFYDFEDKIGQTISHGLTHHHHASASASSLNGYHDRTQVGQLHNNYLYEMNYSLDGVEISTNSNGHPNDSLLTDDNNQCFEHVVVEPFLNNHDVQVLENVQSSLNDSSNLSLENLPGYSMFMLYIDYNETGVQIVEEPIEKKKRKWTAQEILSKCQNNNQNSSSSETNNK